MRVMLVALVALTACGSDEPTAEPGRRYQTTEWYLRSYTDDQRTFWIVYTISGVASNCEREGRAFAEESSENVVLTAQKSVTLDRQRACTEELGYVESRVRLKRPLGDRALVGCRPGKVDASEDRLCRDPERARRHGICINEFAGRLTGRC